MNKDVSGGIHGKERILASDNDELRRYYEGKYQAGGYENGYRTCGVDVSAIYHEARRAAAIQLLGLADGSKILDAGCGDGVFSARLADMGYQVDAVDLAANAFSSKNARENLRFAQMNIEQMSFPDRTFDKIVCVEALEHVLNPQLALRELWRVVKPEGVVVITYPTINRTFAKRWWLGKKLEISEHLTEWNDAELRIEVDSAGLYVEETVGLAFDFGYLLALKRLARALASGITRLSLRIRWFPANSMFVVVRARRF